VYKALWAKKGKSIQSSEEPHFHPLLFHLMDVAAVTECLWQSVLERQLRKEISARLGLTVEQAGKWLHFWAGLHDLGKASPAFQGKWEIACIRLTKAGLPCRKLSEPLRHGVLTAAFVAELLPSLFISFPRALVDRLGRTLGGHHGSFPRAGDIREINREQRGGRRWDEVRLEFFQQFARQFHLEEAGVPGDNPGHSFFLLLAGLVSVADWIGSNADFFPFARESLDLGEYAATAWEKANKALKTLGWLGWRPPVTFVEMGDLFPAVRVHGLRPPQQATAQLAENLPEPGLVILEAPMGEGKTEAAMYQADRWSVALGQRGCYFALPTMATSNQMFSRVKEFLQDRYDEELVNLQLLHGHASLSAEFRELRDEADRIFTPSEIDAEEIAAAGGPPAEVVAAEWFTYRKRGLLAPFGVGTVDQALLAVLKTRHYFVRLFGLAGKTVIIDEVHAYDAYMTKLLERLLEWLAACGCGVVLLSATLPKERRLALVQAFRKGLGRDAGKPKLPAKDPYPRLTWVSRTFSGSKHFPASPQFSRTIRYEWVSGEIPLETGQAFELGARLQEALAGGGCAAVICNTVGRAQEIYRALKVSRPLPVRRS
jgi:CRISPR-associated endonuclease/helicase Cas3